MSKKRNENPFKREKRAPHSDNAKIDENTGSSSGAKKKRAFVTKPTASEKTAAKAAFLSGLGDDDLIKIGNCTPLTLQKWKGEWRDARTSALMVLQRQTLSLNVTDFEIEEHLVYIQGLRTLKAQHEVELESLSTMVNALQKITLKLESHPDFERLDFKQVCSALKAYAEAKDSRSKVQSDYIKCCDTLNTETGLTAYHRAGAAQVMEMKRAEGRIEAAKQRIIAGVGAEHEIARAEANKEQGFFDVE